MSDDDQKTPLEKAGFDRAGVIGVPGPGGEDKFHAAVVITGVKEAAGAGVPNGRKQPEIFPQRNPSGSSEK